MDEFSPIGPTETNISQPDQSLGAADPNVAGITLVPATETALSPTAIPGIPAPADAPEAAVAAPVEVTAEITDSEIGDHLAQRGLNPNRLNLRRKIAVLAATAIIGPGVAACSTGHTSAESAPSSTTTTSQYASPTQFVPSTSSTQTTSPTTIPSTPSHPSTPASSAPETHKPSIMTYEDLPGYGKEASQADIEKLRASTVEILTRQKGNPDPFGWQINCMGTKISYNGKTYIMTARHCNPNLPKSESFSSPSAQDVTKLGDLDFGIRSIQSTDPNGPVAIVASTVVGQADFMLQTVQQPNKNDPNYAADQAGYEAYTNIPTVSYDPNKTIDGAALDESNEIGGLGNASSFTAQSGGTIVNTPGVYLGVLKDPNAADGSVYYQYWAEKVASPASDACYFGDSGLSYLSPSGGLGGPESVRINLKHDPNDDAYPNASLAQRQGFVHDLEQQLGQKYGKAFSLSGFDMICGTTVVTPSLMNNAVNAFQTPAAVKNN